MRYVHHPLIKPAHDVVQAFDAMPWLPRAREFVCFAWKNNHGGWTLHILQRAEQLFAARVLRRTVVGFAEHKQDWSVDVLHKRNCRAVVIVLRVFERRGLEPIRLE